MNVTMTPDEEQAVRLIFNLPPNTPVTRQEILYQLRKKDHAYGWHLARLLVENGFPEVAT